MRTRLALCAAGAALIMACADPAPPPKKPNPSSVVPIIAAEPAAPKEAAPKVVEAEPQTTPADRKARYEGRATVAIPAALPAGWRAAVEGLNGKLTDVAVENQVLAALRAAGVPQVGRTAPSDPVEVNDTRWRLKIDHLVAPPGEPREALVDFSWSRSPKPAAQRPDCSTPEPIDAPGVLPRWLAQATSKEFLRRRIGVGVEDHLDGPVVTQYVLFRNGYAMDDLSGKLAGKLKALGFHHESGEGPRQRWTLPDGSRVSWNTSRADPVIGCIPEGPLLIIEWKGPTP